MKEVAKRHLQVKEELNASNGRTEQEIIVVMRELQKLYDEQLKRMMEMVESRLKETNERLEKQLSLEREARWRVVCTAEEDKRVAEQKMRTMSMNLAEALKSAEESKVSWEDQMKKMREEMEDAKKRALDAQKKCSIL